MVIRLYRIHPYLPSARDESEPGHPLYIHEPAQGGGRIDNPDRYLSFYATSDPVAAFAEKYADLSEWVPEMLEGPLLPSPSRWCLSRYRYEGSVLDLDDPPTLVDQAIRPSRVVSRNRYHTQAWARAIFDRVPVGGVTWWSYHDPDWQSYGLWDIENLDHDDTSELELSSSIAKQAASVLVRRIVY